MLLFYLVSGSFPVSGVTLSDIKTAHASGRRQTLRDVRPDLPAAFGEMRRLLKAGGRAVIADGAAGTKVAGFLNGFVNEHNPMGHVGVFFDELTAGLIEDAGFTITDDALVEMPWQFDSMQEAGAFCRQLFWMPQLTTDEVAAAMDREIGFDLIDSRPHLRWALRRIVCDAV